MRNLKQFLTLGILVTLLFGWSCKDNEVLEYDRSALLSNLGDNVIFPNYNTLSQEATNLELAMTNFRASKSLVDLETLRNQNIVIWKAWKACSMYEFGTAENRALRASINTFPSDTAQIWANVNAATWDLNLATNLDAKGFPALDFLLFGLGNDANSILNRLNAPQDSAAIHNYLEAIVLDIKTLVSAVRDEWQGSYLATFKSSLGTDVGSSTSLLVNALNQDLEIIKTASIGIPIGKQTFGQALPEKCEGLYSGESIALILQQLEGIEALYRGEIAGGTNGYGLKEALDALEAQYQGGSLTAAIDAQFTEAKSAVQAIATPLSVAVLNNAPAVENAYTQIQKLVILLKTDMASAMSILITYTDADGD